MIKRKCLNKCLKTINKERRRRRRRKCSREINIITKEKSRENEI